MGTRRHQKQSRGRGSPIGALVIIALRKAYPQARSPRNLGVAGHDEDEDGPENPFATHSAAGL